ncbi:hypothetical protein Salat_1138300 [Sesamum alatum]|uniref:DUF4283 domain-containing protein n=1 Tax=Sesamum alatum TaxID=300844 RepID=A0AAE2CN70_9LAMI|nr:hypothetical protein Salat_1138300 [Sesamum alatum]
MQGTVHRYRVFIRLLEDLCSPLGLSLPMDQDLHNPGKSLSITDEEENDTLILTGLWHKEVELEGFYIVGRVLSSKSIHTEALRTTVMASFNLVRGMDLRTIDHRRFLLRFNHVLDRDCVLERSPWAFDKNLIIMAKVSGNENPTEIDLN